MKLIALLTTIIMSYTAYSEPFKMAVAGDSLTYGTFSNKGIKTQLGLKVTEEKPQEAPWYFKLLYKITGFPNNNWATGENINSHLVKLRNAFPGQVWEAKNFAVPSSRIEDVAYLQAPKVVAYKPDYLAIAIGANNICHGSHPSDMTTPAQMAFNMKMILDQVKDENRIILIVGLPDISKLPSVVGDKRNILGLKAQTVWSILHECDIVTSGKYVSEISQRVKEYNEVFKSFSTGDKIVFGAGTANMVFTANDVSSIDMFHSSKQGQQKFSDLNPPPFIAK